VVVGAGHDAADTPGITVNLKVIDPVDCAGKRTRPPHATRVENGLRLQLLEINANEFPSTLPLLPAGLLPTSKIKLSQLLIVITT